MSGETSQEAADDATCLLASYSHRINIPGMLVLYIQAWLPFMLSLVSDTPRQSSASADNYDWCIVPDSGYDIIVFAGVAVVVSCLFRGKFSNLMILVAGTTCRAVLFNLKFCIT